MLSFHQSIGPITALLQLQVCDLNDKAHGEDITDKNSTVLIDFSLTVKAATLIFISGRGSAISSAKEGKSGFIYNLV